MKKIILLIVSLSVAIFGETRDLKNKLDVTKLQPLPGVPQAKFEKVEILKEVLKIIPENVYSINSENFKISEIMPIINARFRNAREKMNNKDVEDEIRKIAEQDLKKRLLVSLAKKSDIAEPTEEEIKNNLELIYSRFNGKANFIKEIAKDKLTETKFKEITRENLLVNKLIEKLVAGISISEKECEIYYNNNRDKFIVKKQASASHILKSLRPHAPISEKEKAFAAIKKISDQIKQGADFAELARKESDCPSKKDGGELGFFEEDRMVKPFSKVVFDELKVGEISDIVPTDFGFHIIKKTGEREENLSTLESSKKRIENALRRGKQKEFLDVTFENLKKENNAKINF